MPNQTTDEQKRKNALTDHMGPFPSRINFILTRKNSKQSILIQKFSNKSIKLDNIKAKSTNVFMLDGSVTTSLAIEDINSVEDLEKRLTHYRDRWAN